MIARIWEGKTVNADADTYERLIIERDIPNYRKTEGFVKLLFLKRKDRDYTRFKLISVWQDLAAIKNFTGENYNAAVAYETDRKYLADFPGSVTHFEVFAGEPGV